MRATRWRRASSRAAWSAPRWARWRAASRSSSSRVRRSSTRGGGSRLARRRALRACMPACLHHACAACARAPSPPAACVLSPRPPSACPPAACAPPGCGLDGGLAHISIALDRSAIAALQLSIDAAAVKWAILDTPKLKLKPECVAVQGGWSLSVVPGEAAAKVGLLFSLEALLAALPKVGRGAAPDGQARPPARSQRSHGTSRNCRRRALPAADAASHHSCHSTPPQIQHAAAPTPATRSTAGATPAATQPRTHTPATALRHCDHSRCRRPARGQVIVVGIPSVERAVINRGKDGKYGLLVEGTGLQVGDVWHARVGGQGSAGGSRQRRRHAALGSCRPVHPRHASAPPAALPPCRRALARLCLAPRALTRAPRPPTTWPRWSVCWA